MSTRLAHDTQGSGDRPVLVPAGAVTLSRWCIKAAHPASVPVTASPGW
jgi:hypothetical protein